VTAARPHKGRKMNPDGRSSTFQMSNCAEV
jgi:hypothetical protein